MTSTTPNKPTSNDGFFVILRDDDERLCRHSTLDAVAIEARRLAEKVPGHAFYVLEAVYAAGPVTPPIPFRRVRADDGIPF